MWCGDTFYRQTYESMRYYADWYSRYASSTWEHFSPEQYGYTLVGIAIFGWLLMRSARK